MSMIARRWDFFRRAETGPIIKEKDFILRRYWPRLKELIREYDIRYDPENPVPTDDTLLDDVFKAGTDLLLDVGFLCIDTSRIITFEEHEIKEGLMSLPGETTLGEGKDCVHFQHRELEDKRFPRNIGGPTGTPLSEEYGTKIYQSYANEPLVDVIYMGAPKSVEGCTVKIGSPFEIQAEMINIAWARTALRMAGRSGMPLYGCCFPSLAVDIASSSPEYGYRKTDMRCLWPLPQMKVNYATLTRAAHFAEYGCRSFTAGEGYLGGLPGSPEGAVITAVAECLGTTLLFQPSAIQAHTLNNMYSPWTGEADIMSLWGDFVSNAALTKNTRMILILGAYTYAGPCTETCLREIAAEAIGGVAVGTHTYGIAPNSGLILDHCTGMEPRFRGEVGHAATGIKREDANEIVKKINEKYEEIVRSRNPPRGKRFAECYDTETVTPSKEYQEIYKRVKRELEDLSLKFIY